MVRKATTMILAAMLLGGAATIPTMALARGGGHGGGGHFGGYYGGHFNGFRGHYAYGGYRGHYAYGGYRGHYGYGGYWGDAYASCYPYLGTPYCY